MNMTIDESVINNIDRFSTVKVNEIGVYTVVPLDPQPAVSYIDRLKEISKIALEHISV